MKIDTTSETRYSPAYEQQPSDEYRTRPDGARHSLFLVGPLQPNLGPIRPPRPFLPSRIRSAVPDRRTVSRFPRPDALRGWRPLPSLPERKGLRAQGPPPPSAGTISLPASSGTQGGPPTLPRLVRKLVSFARRIALLADAI